MKITMLLLKIPRIYIFFTIESLFIVHEVLSPLSNKPPKVLENNKPPRGLNREFMVIVEIPSVSIGNVHPQVFL